MSKLTEGKYGAVSLLLKCKIIRQVNSIGIHCIYAYTQCACDWLKRRQA